MELKKCSECGEEFLSYGEKVCEYCAELKDKKAKATKIRVKKQYRKDA